MHQRLRLLFLDCLRSPMFCILLSAGSLGVGSLGGALLQRAIQTLFTVGPEQNSIDGGSLDLLRASSCFGDHRASLLLAAAHLSGLAANRQLVRSPLPPPPSP